MHYALEQLCLCVCGGASTNVSISLTTARVSLGMLNVLRGRQRKVRTERVERAHHVVSLDKKANGATLPPHWTSVLNVNFLDGLQ